MAPRTKGGRARGTALLAAFLAFACALGAAPDAAGQAPRALWTAAGPAPPRRDSTKVRASRAVALDPSLLTNPQSGELALLLPDSSTLTARRLRVEQPNADVVTWFGRIVGDSLGTVILSVVRGSAFGSIHAGDGRIYRLVTVVPGSYVVEDVDPAGVPDERDPHVPLSVDSTGTGSGCTTDDPTRIDVLVAYSAEARTGAGGADAMEAMVHVAVGQANQSYIDSDVAQRLSLVYVGEVTLTETGDVGGPLIAWDDPASVEMEAVRKLRNEHGADIVAFIIERDDDECGYANIMESVLPSFEDEAVAVVVRDCATSAYSFTHELGHVMGARHEWADDDVSGRPNAYDHGHVEVTGSGGATSAWRTVMAVKTECGDSGVADEDCVRLLRWSNPDQTWDGSALGVASGSAQCDNARTLDETAATVANFRCASPGRADTWMKDAWADTGAEPEPALAAEPMWKSPYIWVRNDQDVDLVHAHQHENPIAGTRNYVYVKLHNGDAGASGELEVYVANASTGLAWPADWTRISSTAVASLGAGETRIVESTWTPAASGHYCLVARWVSPGDPMAVAEGTSISDNVRANNNLVWRNVNIVDLSGTTSATASLRLGNPGPVAGEFALLFRSADATRPWAGSIVVELDPKVAAAWRQGGRRGHGFTLRDGRIVVDARTGAVVEGLRLPVGAHPRVGLRFVRNKPGSGARRSRVVDVVQADLRGGQRRVIGGVSYEIREGR